jgi:5-methylcytosine-specific restriction endonuclease McrA
MNGWTLGHCANCDEVLDLGGAVTLFCSERCRSYAKDVRYFRRCLREGRVLDPQVQEALQTRMAFLVVGGYSSVERRLDEATIAAVLAANDGLCCACNARPSAEVDHIDGPSGEPQNLQGLCRGCHQRKTAESFRPMEAEHRATRDAFVARVNRETPLRASDDELNWERQWPSLLAQTRSWAGPSSREEGSGYFGDGSTGLTDDFEHGVYLQMLAERDD